MDAVGVLGEEDERGRCYGHLGRVEDLGPATFDQRWRLAPDRLGDQPVQLARAGTATALAPDVYRRCEDAANALAGLGADRDDRRQVDERRLATQGNHVLVERLVSLL